jgi:RNA polymerase sigma-70 factor (ECF subfamily)
MYPLIAVKKESLTETRETETEDEKLVAAAKNGDSAAFEALVIRNKRLVFAITRRITGSFAEAEDLSQQAFMKAFANLSRFGGRCSFSTWLVSIAVNESRMWHRKARRSREVPMTDLCSGEAFEIPPDFMDWRPNPEATFSQEERSRLLFSAMDRLKPGMRDALRLCDLGEESTIVAGVLLGVTANAVKSRRLRGRVALRRKLESSFFSEKRGSCKNAFDQAPVSASQRDSPEACGVPMSSELRCPAGL